MKEFVGRTAFVTGGASGIGLGMVQAFLGAGMNLVVADLRADHIAQTGEGTPAPGGPPPGFASRFTPEQLARLGSLTHSAEEAREIVLKGVRDNALYIFKAPEFRRGVEERFDAILHAIGKDEAREAVALELIPGLVGSPIYRES